MSGLGHRSWKGWVLVPATRLARSGPVFGALGRQLSALDRRRRLVPQQQLQSGAAGYQARPP